MRPGPLRTDSLKRNGKNYKVLLCGQNVMNLEWKQPAKRMSHWVFGRVGPFSNFPRELLFWNGIDIENQLKVC